MSGGGDPAARLSDGRLARDGLLGESALAAAAEVLGRLRSDAIETVRVLFADQHGILRGKTVTADALRSVFRSGMNVPSSLLLKDTAGRTVFPVWSAGGGVPDGPMRGAGDMLLVPDPDTFRVLPWTPHSAWMFCNPLFSTGAPIPFAPRTVLGRAVDRLDARGWALEVGLEVEFHVLEITDARLDHRDATMPPAPPGTRLLAPGYQFLSEGVYDRLEPVMDALRRNAEGLGLSVRSTEVEMGPGQFEFVFDPATPMAHADHMMMFRAMAKAVCARRGLHATFMCRPKLDNAAASGWHLHQSLLDRATGRNLFKPEALGTLTAEASGWIAGLLDHAAESCLLTTPTVNGYRRYQPFQLAPDRIQWGVDNRGAMVRGLMAPGDGASRIENRVADPAANPYYFFASQILGGLSGIERGLTAPPPVLAPYDADAPGLPSSLIAAIEAFEGGSLFADALGPGFVPYLATIKRAEWGRYLATVSEWEQREYFGLY